MTALRLAPIDLAPARAWIQRIHSHLDAPIGGKVAVAVELFARSTARVFLRPPSSQSSTPPSASLSRPSSAPQSHPSPEASPDD